MKTTSEQLLARAEELEARARALRISAVEMNGHQTQEKQAKVGELFQAATKIRKAVKVWEEKDEEKADAPKLPPLPKKHRYKPSELAPYVVALLDGATRTTIEVRDLLAEQGIDFGVGHVRKILLQLPQVKRASGGRGVDVRWRLKPKHAGGRRRVQTWTPAQHKKFVATMRRKAAEKRAATAAASS